MYNCIIKRKTVYLNRLYRLYVIGTSVFEKKNSAYGKLCTILTGVNCNACNIYLHKKITEKYFRNLTER